MNESKAGIKVLLTVSEAANIIFCCCLLATASAESLLAEQTKKGLATVPTTLGSKIGHAIAATVGTKARATAQPYLAFAVPYNSDIALSYSTFNLPNLSHSTVALSFLVFKLTKKAW